MEQFNSGDGACQTLDGGPTAAAGNEDFTLIHDSISGLTRRLDNCVGHHVLERRARVTTRTNDATTVCVCFTILVVCPLAMDVVVTLWGVRGVRCFARSSDRLCSRVYYVTQWMAKDGTGMSCSEQGLSCSAKTVVVARLIKRSRETREIHI